MLNLDDFSRKIQSVFKEEKNDAYFHNLQPSFLKLTQRDFYRIISKNNTLSENCKQFKEPL